jgi:hypothetical protein
MVSPVSVGQTVRHQRYGTGTVQAILDNGETARVYFKLILLTKYIPVLELIPIDSPLAEHVVTPPGVPDISASVLTVPVKLNISPIAKATEIQSPPPPIGPGKRLVVECLRQGLPPCGNLTDWTVGFLGVRNSIVKALEQAAGENGTGSIFILEAGYGQGKSHVGQLAREIALSHKLMTMHAELDGKAVTLSNGMGLLSRLFASAVLPNTDERGFSAVPGLGTILKHAAGRLHGNVPKGLDLFTSFLEVAESWEGNEEAVELLERYLSGDGKKFVIEWDLQSVLGSPPFKLPALKVSWGMTEDRLKAQASQLLRVVRLGKTAGAKGALIVLDEFDHEFSSSATLSWKAQEFLNVMCGITERESVVFLFLTPSSTELDVSGASRLKLPRLDASEYERVYLQTIGAYRDAFPGYLVAGGEDTLFKELFGKFKSEYQDQGWGPRFFVRAAIEACDRSASMMVPLSEVEV